MFKQVIALLGLLSVGAFAGDTSKVVTDYQPAPAFDRGLSLDAISLYTFEGDEDGWGAGLRANYFFTDKLGLTVGGSWFEPVDVYAADVGILLRMPLDAFLLAPFVGGGAEYRWNGPVDEYAFYASAGVEYKFTERLGLVAGTRYYWPDETGESWVGFGGLRFTF
jgi:hypothetical protein